MSLSISLSSLNNLVCGISMVTKNKQRSSINLMLSAGEPTFIWCTKIANININFMLLCQI